MYGLLYSNVYVREKDFYDRKQKVYIHDPDSLC